MATTWIVSANASRARIFSQSAANQPLQEVTDMVNEAVRLRMVEMTESDKRGPTAGTKSTHNTGGQVPNKLYEPPLSPEKLEAEHFARDLAAFLVKSHQENAFQQLNLVVSPKFLGALRPLIEPLRATIKVELDKDYTQQSANELLELVRANQLPG
jgi:protein required for attachment to host cells